MTKKRRNLRILASIIAAGCVWATGMGNVWAADVNADKITADRITLTDGISFKEENKNYTFDFTIGEIRALRGVYDSTGKILGDDGVVVGLQKHGAGKAIVIDEEGQIKETGSFDTTNTTLFDLMNEYGNVGKFTGIDSQTGAWIVEKNQQGDGNRDGVGFNQDADGKFETIVANYVGTPNFETNNLAIENAIRLDTSNSDRFGEGAAQRNGLAEYNSTIFEANHDFFGVEHYTDTKNGITSATMKMDDNGTQYTGAVKFEYDVNGSGDKSNIVINAPDRQGIISGLKAGDVTSTSSDAINGAQLHKVINTTIVEAGNDGHTWKVANNLNGLANNNYVTIQDTTLVAGADALVISDAGVLTVEVKDTDGNIVSGSADIKTWADSNYAAKTVTITDANGNDSVVNVTDQVVNNYNEINNINKNNVSKVTVNGDVLTFHQTIGGQDADVVYTDKHITGFSQTDVGAYGAQDAGKVTSTITTNFGQTYTDTIDISGYVSDAITNEAAKAKYDSNYTYNDNTIGGAIQNIQDNHVTYIQDAGVNQGGTHIWNVTQTKGGDSDDVTITDTKNKSLTMEWLYDEDADGNRFRGDYIQTTVTDTEGNKVSGWIGDIAKASLLGKMTDITDNADMHSNVRARAGIKNAHGENGITVASLVGEAYSEAYRKTRLMTDDNNLIVEEVRQLSRSNEDTGTVYKVRTNSEVAYDKVTINNGGPVIHQEGIDMNQKNITNLADGVNPTDAVNVRQLDRLGGRLDKVGAGAAALAALHPMDFDPDDKLQFSAGVGNYKGETAAALGAFYRPTEKVMFSVAGTMGNGENMVNAGVTFALDRKNNVSNSRVAMAHEIKDLRDQVAALTALVSQIAGNGNPLLDTVMFPDVPENHWAYDYIDSLQKRGIIEGYPDGNFGGDRSCTRYEYAAMLYRALEKGFPVDGRLLKEFEAELGRIRIDRIKGADDDANKVERVRVNDYEDRDDYGSKLAQVVADAAPAIEEEPAA